MLEAQKPMFAALRLASKFKRSGDWFEVTEGSSICVEALVNASQEHRAAARLTPSALHPGHDTTVLHMPPHPPLPARP